MRTKIEGLIFIAIMFVCGAMAGCDRSEFEKEHPVTAQAIETTVDIAEEIAENEIEDKLKLPHDSIDINIEVFPNEIPH